MLTSVEMKLFSIETPVAPSAGDTLATLGVPRANAVAWAKETPATLGCERLAERNWRDSSGSTVAANRNDGAASDAARRQTPPARRELSPALARTQGRLTFLQND